VRHWTGRQSTSAKKKHVLDAGYGSANEGAPRIATRSFSPAISTIGGIPLRRGTSINGTSKEIRVQSIQNPASQKFNETTNDRLEKDIK